MSDAAIIKVAKNEVAIIKRNRVLTHALISSSLVLGLAVMVSAKEKEDASSGRAGNWRSNAQGAPSIKQCRKRVEANPGDADAQSDLGWALRQNGQLKEAEVSLRKAISLNSKLSYAHSNLSVVLLDEGQKDEALQEAKQAAMLESKQPIYHVVYGNALLANGNAKSAIEEYKIAIGQRSDYENAYYNLARALKQDGQILEAKVVLSQALDLDHEDVRVLKMLDELSSDGTIPGANSKPPKALSKK